MTRTIAVMAGCLATGGWAFNQGVSVLDVGMAAGFAIALSCFARSRSVSALRASIAAAGEKL